MSRLLPSFLLFVGLSLIYPVTSARASDEALTFATWSGVYGSAQQAAIIVPFSRETGISVRIHHHDGDLRDVMEGSAATWDVVDLEKQALDIGCAEGKFERLDLPALLGPGALDDFVEGTLHPCGIGTVVWTQAVAYDTAAFKEEPPRTLANFFDLVRYPGRRGLSESAEGVLEIALMADGVPPDDVYDILRKPGGVDRAFQKLEPLRGQSEFWLSGADAERLLNEGRVTMTTAYASRFLRPRQGARRPAKLMRANQLWRGTYLAVPVETGRTENALRFITFASDPQRLAGLASRLWFGPSRVSALDLVPKNQRQELPTVRQHFHDALAVDAGFWTEFGPAIEARYAAWRGF